MSKRKFGFEGFGINKRSSYEFEASHVPRRMYIPSPTRKQPQDEEGDLDSMNFDDEEDGGQSRRPQRQAELGGDQDEAEDSGTAGEVEDKEEEEEIDPLDAFMVGIHEEVKKAPTNPRPKREILEDEEDDPMESFLKARRDAGLSLAAEALHAGYDTDEEVYAAAKAVDAGMVEYDSDDNAVITLDRKKIEPLAALEHNDIDYEPFNKDFYEEAPAISGLTEEEVSEYRQSMAIKVSGFDVPRPVKSFDHLGFDASLRGAITKQGYENPTPIQCQALPVALAGRDMIGIAKTGSGKTAAFVLPMIVHVMDQEEVGKGEGPIAVICAPTRELAHQIYLETKKFAKVQGIKVSGVFGGMSKFEQFKELKAGCEVVVATPGRLIDMLKMKALTMTRATYLVLDEADRMFDLGFEPQIRSIVGQIRPDRQTLLFSATMPRRVERLAREVLSDPIRVTVGEVGMANEDISQVVTVLPTDMEKIPWLLNKLPEMVDDGDVLVFASTKLRVEEIEGKLIEACFKVAALHGDKDQSSRMDVLKSFKAGQYHVLVATDVAARGLDIKSIKTVVNFDSAKDMDSHVHRIGRTGRAGDKEGVAHTLVTQKEARFAGELVNSLIASGQNVSTELMDLAMKDGRFRAQREGRKGSGGRGKGKVRGRGRGGGGSSGGATGGGNGGGRSVRGVDYGMGIGYNPESINKTSQPTPAAAPREKEVSSRGVAVDALKMGMMARFKSSFVAASSGAGGTTGSGSYAATPQHGSVPQGRVHGGIGSNNGKSGHFPNSSVNHLVREGGSTAHGMVQGSSLSGFSRGNEATTVTSAADSSPTGPIGGSSMPGLPQAKTQGITTDASGSRRERRRPSGWDR